MTHPFLALQKAVLATLLADAAVAALAGDRIYDAAPRDAAFPYIAFGPARSTDLSSSTEQGAEHRLVLHLWSRRPGKSECLALAEAVGAALGAALTLDGAALVNFAGEALDIARDPDGITWHGVIRFRAVTETP
jgi:hypothetical protein